MLDIATVGALAGPAFQTAFNKLVADRVAKAFTFANPEKVKTDLAPHLESTFNKCIRIKTLINPATQSDFLSIYSTQRFSFDGKNLDHYDLIEHFKRSSRHAIVTGTGGAGKSMFMRYLWLSLFVESEGKIPIFVELRSLNKISQADISPYLFHTLTRGRSKLSLDSFRKGLERGEFYVILDGYDELNDSIRSKVQEAIIELTEDYPSTNVIVSSRPDQQFASWQNFDVIEVAPLRREDTIELVEKIDFDDTIKARFIDKIKIDQFYNANESFLSNPLLASMMLLAFSQNYDIPDKMHQFYELAFEALYKRHDSYKPRGFKRQFMSTKDEDEFRRVFSYFCLLTFYEQKFEFNQSALDGFISSAIDLNQSKFSSSSYVADLCDAVCILIKDGSQFAFPHRSFQEYFAAYCLSFVTKKNFCNILLELCKRPTEQAIPMIRDMNPELLRDEFVVPMAIKHRDALKNVANESNIARFMEASEMRVQAVKVKTGSKKSQVHLFLDSHGEFDNIARTFRRLGAGDVGFRQSKARRNFEFDKEIPEALVKAGMAEDLRITVEGRSGRLRASVTTQDSKPPAQILTTEGERFIVQAVYDTFIHGFVGPRMKDAAAYADRELAAATRSTQAMRSIFGD